MLGIFNVRCLPDRETCKSTARDLNRDREHNDKVTAANQNTLDKSVG